MLPAVAVRLKWEYRDRRRRGCELSSSSNGVDMGDPTKNSPQTNYMPEEEFVMRREAAKRRGDIWMHTSGDLLVPFDSDFDKFAANVAYAIRGLVVYRSDGGVFARGLVRASGHLKMYHDAQMAVTPPTNGTKIRLVAIFYRRKDPR